MSAKFSAERRSALEEFGTFSPDYLERGSLCVPLREERRAGEDGGPSKRLSVLGEPNILMRLPIGSSKIR